MEIVNHKLPASHNIYTVSSVFNCNIEKLWDRLAMYKFVSEIYLFKLFSLEINVNQNAENINIWCSMFGSERPFPGSLVSPNVRKSEYLWVWSIVTGPVLPLAGGFIIWQDPGLSLAAVKIGDCEALSNITLGILLKYPFCFDLSFDWNCPEKIAKHQNMPHQFVSNHWRYFDREDCFLTKAINLQNSTTTKVNHQSYKSSLDFSKF